MLKNYLVSTLRQLRRKGIFSAINILGLAIGMAAFLMIVKYTSFELSYEHIHQQADRIHRITTESYRNGEFRGEGFYTPFAMGVNLEKDFPEIQSYVRLHYCYGGAVLSAPNEHEQAVQFFEEDIYFVDSSFSQVFDYPFLFGDPQTALTHPSDIVITAEVAQKFFGSVDASILGKPLKMEGGWAEGEYFISGIIDQVPKNTHIQFHYLVNNTRLLSNRQYKDNDGWGWYNFYTYVLLAPNTDAKALEAKLPEFILKYRGESLARANAETILHLQPLKDIHLYSTFENEPVPANQERTVYFMALIAVLILLIAWVNYINLSTARAMERAKEVGVRKAIGARRKSLLTQFLFESVFTNTLALILAIGIAVLSLPYLGEMLGKDLAITLQGNPYFWLSALALFSIGALLSGIYPALVLSAYNPVEVLKSGFLHKGQGALLRKSLVVIQFTASITLIIGAFAVYQQLQFMQNQDLGMNMDQMMIVRGPYILEREQYESTVKSFKQSFAANPQIENVAASQSIPGAGHNWGTNIRRLGQERSEAKSGSIVWVDYNFLDTYEMELISGRPFEEKYHTNLHSVIINQAAIQAYGLGDSAQALQERLQIGDDTLNIIGVLQDYNWQSLATAQGPMLLAPNARSGNYFSFKLSTQELSQTLAGIEEAYRSFFPGNPFNYYFADEFFDRQYKSDKQFGKVFGMFTLLAILVACLGLFGLSSFTTAQRTREIGIRKVLGASSGNIVALLSQNFLGLILIAIIIALPLSWWGISNWLESYTYRMPINALLFLVPVIGIILMAMLTIVFHTMKAAMQNPVSSIRTE